MLTIDLAGKVALVIGGSRGIGGSITELLSRAGASVIFTHTGDPARKKTVDSFVSEIQEQDGTVEAVMLDATDSTGATTLADRIVAERGKIDILVHNVGRNHAQPAEDVSDHEWRLSIDLNLSSAFYEVRAVLPHMVNAQSGRIILIGSSVAYDGGGSAIGYAAAKSALDGMMKYLVRNYARQGIITNVVHPCVIETELLRERYADPEKRKALIAQVPIGRLGKPEDIANIVAFLVSPAGEFICGQSILVDGGRTSFR